MEFPPLVPRSAHSHDARVEISGQAVGAGMRDAHEAHSVAREFSDGGRRSAHSVAREFSDGGRGSVLSALCIVSYRCWFVCTRPTRSLYNL